jgi:hypothetical protein
MSSIRPEVDDEEKSASIQKISSIQKSASIQPSKLKNQSTAASLKQKTNRTTTTKGSVRPKKQALNQVAVEKSRNDKVSTSKKTESTPPPHPKTTTKLTTSSSVAVGKKSSNTLSTRGETNNAVGQTDEVSAWNTSKLHKHQQKQQQQSKKQQRSSSWSEVSMSEHTTSYRRNRSSCSCCRIPRSPLFYIALLLVIGALTAIFVLNSLRKTHSLPNSTKSRPDLELEVGAIKTARAQNDVRTALESFYALPAQIKSVSVHDEAQVDFRNFSVSLRIAQIDLLTTSPAIIEQVQTMLLNSENSFANATVLSEHDIDIVYVFAQEAMLSICSNATQRRFGREQLLFEIPCDNVVPSKTGCPNSDFVGLECNICLNGFRNSTCNRS